MPALFEQLNKAYFWDVDILKMDEEKSKRLVIERVMNYGNLHEIMLVKKYYGIKEVKSILCKLNYIDPKTLNFVSLLFHVPKKKFRCYTRKHLTSQPWNY
ncbi:MAG: hypothetical protein CVT94_15315 [Bacteroidetes bacterium HGW-Bacteroidetes-11]|jgi:hypothetical protein|nr:MAG: hypothetical protein CVT94_15315 [Bacteroidetes bacterium HGW-Bacteroidetes-11]